MLTSFTFDEDHSSPLSFKCTTMTNFELISWGLLVATITATVILLPAITIAVCYGIVESE